MKAVLLKKELARSASMLAVMRRYAHAFFNQVAQSTACNHFHTLDQRCCRWLLMTHDRMHPDEFLLTQEFLAMMPGVQRAGVAAAAGALQRTGLIRCKRGNVTILDRRGLMRRSCECYGISKRGSIVSSERSQHARPIPVGSETDTHAVARGSAAFRATGLAPPPPFSRLAGTLRD